jgi:aspartate racemase
MKKIGLVGGTTPESTKVYYEELISAARKPGEDPLHNPVILIYSLDLAELVALQRRGTSEQVAGFLARILEKLHAAGAEVAALTANTPHAYLEELRERASLPLVSIVTATCAEAKKQTLKRCLLLGTRTTIEAEMYPDEFAFAGIEIIRPGEDDRVFLDDVIYNDLAVGKISLKMRQRFLEICANHVERDGIDSVILGCTEIPLVFSQADLSIKVLDTTKIHVRAILEAAE